MLNNNLAVQYDDSTILYKRVKNMPDIDTVLVLRATIIIISVNQVSSHDSYRAALAAAPVAAVVTVVAPAAVADKPPTAPTL